jgi:ATP-dependent protease Clp ATPase subunit
VQCSFCDKTEEQVAQMFTRRDSAAICDECVNRCVGAMNAPAEPT